jgi:hypothetical protein
MATTPLQLSADKNLLERLRKSVDSGSVNARPASSAGVGSQGGSQGGSTNPLGYPYTDITKTQISNPTLGNTADMAARFGYNVDEAGIREQMNNATRTQFAADRAAAMQTENQGYADMLANQRTNLDMLRKAQAEAVMSGAAKGASAANKLSSLLTSNQQNSQLATQLAQARNKLAFDESAAIADNTNKARTEVQERIGTIAGQVADLYGYDTQAFSAALQAAMGYQQGEMNLEGTRYTADKQLTGVKETNKTNVTTTKLTNKSNEKVAGVKKSSSKKTTKKTTSSGKTPKKVTSSIDRSGGTGVKVNTQKKLKGKLTKK